MNWNDLIDSAGGLGALSIPQNDEAAQQWQVNSGDPNNVPAGYRYDPSTMGLTYVGADAAGLNGYDGLWSYNPGDQTFWQSGTNDQTGYTSLSRGADGNVDYNHFYPKYDSWADKLGNVVDYAAPAMIAAIGGSMFLPAAGAGEAGAGLATSGGTAAGETAAGGAAGAADAGWVSGYDLAGGGALGDAGAVGGAAGSAAPGWASGYDLPGGGSLGTGGTGGGAGWMSALKDLAPYAGPAASLVGAGVNANAAGKAANAELQAANQANDTQRYMYDQTRADQMPWVQRGNAAGNRLQTLLGLSSDTTDPAYGSLARNFSAADMNADPVYQSGLQFGLNEGEKGINRQAAATGNLLSGATLKALTKYGNDYASTKGNESFNRFNTNRQTQYNMLSGVAGTGQMANNQVASAGQNMANNVSQNQLAAGNSRAAGYIGSANAINGGISQGWNMYQSNQLMNALASRNGSGYNSFANNYNPYSDPYAMQRMG
jgi:hypothetical protein